AAVRPAPTCSRSRRAAGCLPALQTRPLPHRHHEIRRLFTALQSRPAGPGRRLRARPAGPRLRQATNRPLDDVNSGSVNSELGRLAASAEHNPLDCLVVILICEYGFLLTPPSGVVHRASGRSRAWTPATIATAAAGTASLATKPTPSWRTRCARNFACTRRCSAGLARTAVQPWPASRVCSSCTPARNGTPGLYAANSPAPLWFHAEPRAAGRVHLPDPLPGVSAGPRLLHPVCAAALHGQPSVPNPAQELAKAMLTAGQQNSDRGAELTDMVLELMAKVGDSGCAEIAMPKVFSTLTKLVRFPASDGRVGRY
ncbi:hypothetical protein BOX15_Mlig012903g4, partial [Macrostomum lignano]